MLYKPFIYVGAAMYKKFCVGASAAVVAACGSPALARTPLDTAIAADYQANLRPLFETFHHNPELSGMEVHTAARMAAELRALGFDVTEKVGGTGVVAVLKNGPGRTVLLRADMDGLPILEKTGLSYASTLQQKDEAGTKRPVMHACGHDVHITSLIGAARQLAERRDEWSGAVVLVAQPAEESLSGARAMLDDGLYTRFPKPDYAIAFHVAASLQAGKIEVPPESVASSADSLEITVHGVGTHAAFPDKGVDPILVASQIVVSLQSLVSRTKNPLLSGVVTVGSFHGGVSPDIISDRVDMQVTVRADDFAVRKQLLAGVERVVRGVAISMGVPDNLMPEIRRVEKEAALPTRNDPATASRIRSAFIEHFGSGQMVESRREGMNAEDFSYYVAPETGVKGVYFNVGGTPESELKTAAGHHSPLFKIEPEASIRTGVEAMTVGALTLLRKEN